ncbi:MAG: acyltransferase family protein [Bacteroides sp.]|nr:acyltransferase family protein [Roseburia sp.]MCM1346925.1 acyltransferase family protein [Bacteroides sp.]MCM1421456.1 acyltransferase family protein [Bacteroides sp.]
MKESRDNSVSIAKAIAIMLMVLAHTQFSRSTSLYINMFHMPLFFFMAGYCFKEKYLLDTRKFVLQKIKGIYVPYVKWSLLFLVLHNIFFYLDIYSGEFGFNGLVSSLYSWNDFARRFMYIVTRMSGHEQLLGGYWFMKSLFFASLISFLTIKYVRKIVIGGGILLAVTFLLYVTNWSIPYFGIGARETFASVFFVVGYTYKKYNMDWHNRPAIIPVIALLLVPSTMFWSASLLDMDVVRLIPWGFTAVVGTLMVFATGKLLCRSKKRIQDLLVFIGDNTLDVLTWHFLSFKIVSLPLIWLYDLPQEQLGEFPTIECLSRQGWWIAYFIIGLGLPLVWKMRKL